MTFSQSSFPSQIPRVLKGKRVRSAGTYWLLTRPCGLANSALHRGDVAVYASGKKPATLRAGGGIRVYDGENLRCGPFDGQGIRIGWEEMLFRGRDILGVERRRCNTVFDDI